MDIQKKSSYKNIILNIIFIFSILSLIFIKMYLCSSQYPFLIPWMGHDDGLLLEHAMSITEGNWLGEYNSLTLAKGMFFSLWEAFINYLSIPILIANQFLYLLCCLYTLIVIRSLIKNRLFLFLVFSLLFFNPVSYDVSASLRIYRDSIYPTIVVFFFLGLIGMFLNRNNVKSMMVHSFIGGFSFGIAWNTREDTFWLIPFFVAVLIFTFLFIVFDKNLKARFQKIKPMLCILLTIMIFFLINSIVAFLNFNYYGRFVINDYMSSEFQGAYGALTRIKNENWIADVPVPEDVRLKVYKVSPAFLELKPYLEEGKGMYSFKYHIYDDHYDYKGGWFFWAIRGAAEKAGYYERPMDAKEFFERLEYEVNDACDRGMLKTQAKKRATLAPVFRNEYIKPWISASLEAFSFVNKFKCTSPIPLYFKEDEKPSLIELKAQMADYLHSPITPSEFTREEIEKYEILEDIIYVYQRFNQNLTFISMICYLILFITLIWKWLKREELKDEMTEFLILSGFFLMIIVRVVMIAFVHVSSFSAINVQYLSSVHPLLILFNILAICFYGNRILKFALFYSYLKKSYFLIN